MHGFNRATIYEETAYTVKLLRVCIQLTSVVLCHISVWAIKRARNVQAKFCLACTQCTVLLWCIYKYGKQARWFDSNQM